MKNEILQKLNEIEQNKDVKILYACESGSRAWGFASQDSDYDVRFIYTHKLDLYLGIDEHKDVIELPVNAVLDINGWDIKKAFRLLRKSNSPLFEWLNSPIIYKMDNVFLNKLSKIKNDYFNPRAGMHHYLSMTKNCLENNLQTDDVGLKKYFYALRPILAAMWIGDKMEVPPMEFSKLRTLISDSILNKEIDILMEKKLISNEKTMIKKVEHLNEFILENLNKYDLISSSFESKTSDTDTLNILFRETINEF